MTLAVDVIDRLALVTKCVARYSQRRLIKAVLAVYIAARHFTRPLLLTRWVKWVTHPLLLKMGVSYGW